MQIGTFKVTYIRITFHCNLKSHEYYIYFKRFILTLCIYVLYIVLYTHIVHCEFYF